MDLSTLLFGTARQTRTDTVQFLKLLSLPIGIRRHGVQSEARTQDPRHVKAVR